MGIQELAAPNVEEPENGYLIPNIDLTPLCSPKYRSAASTDDAQVLTCHLNNIIRDSKWIDLKQLCIAKEKLVWILYCDITCIDYDGSILDASVVALCAALRSCMFVFFSFLISFMERMDRYYYFVLKFCFSDIAQSSIRYRDE